MRNIIFIFFVTLSLSACGDNPDISSGNKASPNKQAESVINKTATATLTVYKSPTCGCCGAWVDHMEGAGVQTTTIEDADMAAIKNRFNLPMEARSCHTATHGDYFFEGHVPPALVKAFLQSPPPEAKGLIVPGMPIGSAGMEDGDKFQPYKVWLMTNDGEFREFAAVDTYAEQF